MSRALAVVSLSGGMDSSTLLAHIHQTYDVLALSFNYGQRHARELTAAAQIAEHYDAEWHEIDLRSVGKLLTGSALTDPSVPVPEGHYAEETMRATVVANRNAIMANIAIGIASARGAELVALGIHAGDHAVYPDCRPQWVAALRDLAAKGLDGFHTPKIVTPFVTWTKADIAAEGARLGVPLGLTWSCYKGGELKHGNTYVNVKAKHCGCCGTCVERIEAFRDAGVPDPTEYHDTEFAASVLA
jgi:7-cyano-7-deazaguanine synthase